MASNVRYNIQKLDGSHDRSGFDCGIDSLNEYLSKFARQNTRKGIGTTYVAVKEGDVHVLAYYTISSGQIARETIPESERKALPRYPVPILRIGRLAADVSTRGKGLGSMMLVDALRRAFLVSDVLGICGVEVDAINEDARNFYLKYGFESLLDDRRHMFINMKTIKRLFNQD